MKKKAFLTLIALAVGMLNTVAENVIQVVPATTKPGVTSDDAAYLSFEMINEEENIVGYEFKIKLPEGMDFDDSDPVNAPAFELTLDPRYPYTGRTKVYQHSVNYTKMDDGWWYVIVTSSQLNPIKELSGEIMKGYFTTESTMQPGIYPIIIKETLMGISGTEKAETADVAVSYVAVSADGTVSPLTTDQDLDMSTLAGYVPSFVVAAMNDDMAVNENLRSLNLSGATGTGADVVVPENVAYAVGNKGGLKRSFRSGQKSTVCLPFALSEEQVAAIKEQGSEIEMLSGYNAEKSSVQFEAVTAMAEHTPYLVTVTGETPVPLFEDIDGVVLGDLTVTPTDVTAGALTMRGAYEKETISSDDHVTYYAYDAADGSFVRIGLNATVTPFRAYLMLADGNGARSLTISDETTGIENVNVNDNDNLNVNGNGNTQFFDLQGRCIDGAAAKGVYILNGRKVVKK